TVKSKASGAQRWAADLARMYLGWGKARGLTVSVLGEDLAPTGRQASLTLALSGFGVYGLLRGEAGVHKLVHQVKLNGRDSLQRFSADVAVLPELGDDDLPALDGLQIATKSIARAGLVIGRLTGQGSAHLAGGGGLTLAGDLPAEELAAEAARLLRIERWLVDHPLDTAEPTAPGGLVRTYARNTREKGVIDHRTGRRSLKVTQVLAGEIQEFLDSGLRRGT
ncbi:MAG TPA: PCRF domain-containing protein, partial [Anaerolineales bacterium]|nr:PCRF domain-containing protein [Anaerolineales bacterium]